MKSKTRTFMLLCLILSLSAGVSHVLFLRVLVLEPEEQFFWTYRYDEGSSIMKDRERDILRKTILELLTKGCVHYTDLDKKVCASCHPFATTNTFKSQLHYLLGNDYITRVSRGIYRITLKGQQYLALLMS